MQVAYYNRQKMKKSETTIDKSVSVSQLSAGLQTLNVTDIITILLLLFAISFVVFCRKIKIKIEYNFKNFINFLDCRVLLILFVTLLKNIIDKMTDVLCQISEHSKFNIPIICNKKLLEQFNSLDVTDNKNDSTNIVPIMSSAQLNIEEERRKTFQNWPLTFIDKFRLAETGMYFTGYEDKVKCYFCKVEIGRWEQEDSPVGEHLRWSPNCPLLKRRSTNNIPIDSDNLDQVLPPPTYDVCGNNDFIEIRPGSFEESCISANPVPVYLPEHPEYAIESARVRSFKDWPRLMKQTPEELSEAGFFYTGVGDRVICYSCGGGLKDWDEFDYPWEQHALWLGNCPYLKLMKGQSYIDATLAKFKNIDKQAESEQDILKAAADTINETNRTNNTDSIESNNDNNRNNSSSNNNLPEATQSKNDSNISFPSRNRRSSATAKDDNKPVKKTDTKIIPDDEKLCKICYAAEYNTAFLPCGHVVACAKCASSVTKCPMCRKPFTNIMRVYFS